MLFIPVKVLGKQQRNVSNMAAKYGLLCFLSVLLVSSLLVFLVLQLDLPVVYVLLVVLLTLISHRLVWLSSAQTMKIQVMLRCNQREAMFVIFSKLVGKEGVLCPFTLPCKHCCRISEVSQGNRPEPNRTVFQSNSIHELNSIEFSNRTTKGSCKLRLDAGGED